MAFLLPTDTITGMPTIEEVMPDLMRRHEEATRTGDAKLLTEVENEYNSLLNQHPDEPLLLFPVLTVALQKGYHGLAVNGYRWMLHNWPETKKMPQTWNNLGTSYKGEHMDDKARECWEEAIALVDPDKEEERGLYAEYCSNLSTLYINTGNPAGGLQYAKDAVELQPENLKNWWNLSLIELELGRWEDGWKHYDKGVQSGDRYNRWPDVPYYNGEDLTGKRVLLYGEQGIGDEIMFAGALRQLCHAADKVFFECHDRLENLFRSSTRDVENLEISGTRKMKQADYRDIVVDGFKPDYTIGIGSLFRWFGIKSRAPYLKPNPELVEMYRERLNELGPGLKVGVGYAGGHKKTHSHERSFKLGDLGPILDIPGCEFVSLQYTPEATGKFDRHFMQTGRKVHHWPDVLYRGEDPGEDYEHTAALIKALDIIVVPNTTAVHCAGAIGTPCITLTPRACAWRYRNNRYSEMVMYGPHVSQVFETVEGWDGAFKAVATAIGNRAEDWAA